MPEMKFYIEKSYIFNDWQILRYTHITGLMKHSKINVVSSIDPSANSTYIMNIILPTLIGLRYVHTYTN